MLGRKINKYANQLGQNYFFLHKRNLILTVFLIIFVEKNLYIVYILSLSYKNLRTFKNNDTKKFEKWKEGEVIKNSVIY